MISFDYGKEAAPAAIRAVDVCVTRVVNFASDAGSLIAPGKQIGMAALGLTRPQMHEALGKPDETACLAGGIVREDWLSKSNAPKSYVGVHPDADTFQAIVWRPDSKAVAVASGITRDYVECKLYLLAKGDCTEVKLPDFAAVLKKKCGGELSDKGHETPVKWLGNDRLVWSVGNRACEKELRVMLRVTEEPHSNRTTATVESMEETPPVE